MKGHAMYVIAAAAGNLEAMKFFKAREEPGETWRLPSWLSWHRSYEFMNCWIDLSDGSIRMKKWDYKVVEWLLQNDKLYHHTYPDGLPDDHKEFAAWCRCMRQKRKREEEKSFIIS